MTTEEKHFINGIYACVHTGHIEKEDFWEIIKEMDFKKEDVSKMILPNTDQTIKELFQERKND